METSQNAAEGGKYDNKKEKLENWEKAEKLFEEFLNMKEIPFFRIDQKKDTKSKVLMEKSIRRPDYIIQTKNDYFYVDVKQRSKIKHEENNKKRFTLDLFCLFALRGFFKNFNKEIWLAFINDLVNPNFYFIPLSQVIDYFENLEDALGSYSSASLLKDCDCQKEICKDLFLYIPENLFFNKVSFEKGFYKETDNDFFNKEALFHREKWKNTLEYNYNIVI
jgi:hypothetical protein